MTDNTYIFGADTEIKWMVHITVVDEVYREKKEYYRFFETRAEADAYVTDIVNSTRERNIVIRICRDNKSFDLINSCMKGRD